MLKFSRLEFGQPAQCTQPGQEAVLAASCDHKSRQALQPPAQWSLRDVKSAVSLMRARNGVSTSCPSEERTVIHPLGLNELELPAQMGSDEREHQAPVLAVIFQDPVRQ